MAVSKKNKYLIICAVIVLGTILAFWLRLSSYMMPGQSFTGPLPPMTPEETFTRNMLSGHVDKLASQIGERNVLKPQALARTAQYINDIFIGIGGYTPKFQEYEAMGQKFKNIEVELPGTDPNAGIIIVGAHYDTSAGSPGGNDNASGLACLFEMARLMKGKQFPRTVRFVAFVNGEPPFWNGTDMGSARYADRCQQLHEKIVAMFSLDEVGFFTQNPNSQKFPSPINSFYPTVGNFLLFTANQQSADLLRQSVSSFRGQTKFPCEGLIATDSIPSAEFSDHLYFWRKGYPAILVNDTIVYRYDDYHKPTDEWNKVDVDSECRVVHGMVHLIEDLAGLH